MNLWQEIKLYKAAKQIESAAKEVDMNQVKAGLKTSEFWIAILAAIIPVLNQNLGLHIPIGAIMTVGTVAITYILNRMHIKTTAIKAASGAVPGK